MNDTNSPKEEQMGTKSNYWDKVLTRRLTRRRSLGAMGGAAAAAAFLAACGGDDDSGGSNTPREAVRRVAPVDRVPQHPPNSLAFWPREKIRVVKR